MSRLIDRLEKAGRSTPTPLGFGASARRVESAPAMMLIGQIAPNELKADPGPSDFQVDALLVSLDSWEARALEGVADSMADFLWGVRADGIDEKRLQQLKDRGCDFIVFDAESTAGVVLNDDEMGKLIAVGSELSEELAHAIQSLPIDGALFSPSGELLPLTVKKLIEVEQVSGLLDKPLVMIAPSELSAAVLESLRNAGVVGLVVELTSPDVIAGTKEAIADIPHRRPRPASTNPIVPQVSIGLDAGHDDDSDDFP